jgi:phosphoenolpyruvate synthase/pyruvate phosphate dikinase
MSNVILPLDRTISQANGGGKAANLASMMAAGLPVPPGFVVTVNAYKKFLTDQGLEGKISAKLGSADFSDEKQLDAVSASIKSMIISSPLDHAMVTEIHETLALGGETLWAVRSSATAEDLPQASYAGQQDTYLNVGRADVPARIKDCWASYWNARAIAYRHNAKVPSMEGGIAVVIQEMVNSDSAGILFTMNPVSGNKDEIVIESSWGLGESIVSGLVGPDRFICSKEPITIREKRVGAKTKGIYLHEGQSRTLDIDPARQVIPSLTDSQITDLVSLGRRIELHFGLPQDIEWAISKGRVYVLQSRPITTSSCKDEILWTRAYGDEYWADITSPLFYSWLGEWLSKYVLEEGYEIMGYWDLKGLPLLHLHKGHIFFNSAVLEAVFTYNPRFSRTKELLNYFPEKDQERIANAKTKILRRIWAEVRIAFKDPDGMIIRTAKAYNKWADEYLAKMKPFDSMDLAKLSDEELYGQYKYQVDSFLKHYRLIRYGMVTHSIGMNLMVKRWLMDWLDDKSGAIYSSLLSGLPDNKTIKTNNALIVLARSARNDPAVSKPLFSLSSAEFYDELRSRLYLAKFRDEFDEFMREYGHRSHTREIYFPRWADDPTLVVDILRSLASAPDIDVERLEKEKAEQRLATEKEIGRRISALSLGFFKKRIFNIILGYAQIYLQFRENQRFYLDHMIARQRRIFVEYGRRYATRGFIGKPDDIFFLSKEEIFEIAKGTLPDMKEKISERRAEFERYRDYLPPKFLQGGIEFDDTVVSTDGLTKVTGTSSSPGIATGVIRVVDSIERLSEVMKDEILVTQNTDPGWTPVFSKLGGLITETGGILSHGAVVSREYGIPAVTAVKGARQIFRTGQRVTIDGNEGVIYLMERQEK